MHRIILSTLLATLFFCGPLSAREEHSLSTITGTDIDLKVYDHAFAGSIHEFVVWGALDESKGVSELIMRRDGQTIRTTFGKKDAKVGGTISYQENSKIIETKIYFDRLDTKTNTFYINVNGTVIPVEVKADGFANNHFINPTYSAHIDGKDMTFTLKGEACYGYSLHLIMMIVGAYVH